MFGYAHVKVNGTKNLSVKINFIIISYNFYLQVESILEVESIIFLRSQTSYNQFYTPRINFGPSRSGTKDTLEVAEISQILS
jgi:hypothetical protein